MEFPTFDTLPAMLDRPDRLAYVRDIVEIVRQGMSHDQTRAFAEALRDDRAKFLMIADVFVDQMDRIGFGATLARQLVHAMTELGSTDAYLKIAMDRLMEVPAEHEA